MGWYRIAALHFAVLLLPASHLLAQSPRTWDVPATFELRNEKPRWVHQGRTMVQVVQEQVGEPIQLRYVPPAGYKSVEISILRDDLPPEIQSLYSKRHELRALGGSLDGSPATATFRTEPTVARPAWRIQILNLFAEPAAGYDVSIGDFERLWCGKTGPDGRIEYWFPDTLSIPPAPPASSLPQTAPVGLKIIVVEPSTGQKVDAAVGGSERSLKAQQARLKGDPASAEGATMVLPMLSPEAVARHKDDAIQFRVLEADGKPAELMVSLVLNPEAPAKKQDVVGFASGRDGICLMPIPSGLLPAGLAPEKKLCTVTVLAQEHSFFETKIVVKPGPLQEFHLPRFERRKFKLGTFEPIENFDRQRFLVEYSADKGKTDPWHGLNSGVPVDGHDQELEVGDAPVPFWHRVRYKGGMTEPLFLESGHDGEDALFVQLDDSAMITGRFVEDGKPLPGVRVVSGFGRYIHHDVAALTDNAFDELVARGPAPSVVLDPRHLMATVLDTATVTDSNGDFRIPLRFGPYLAGGGAGYNVVVGAASPGKVPMVRLMTVKFDPDVDPPRILDTGSGAMFPAVSVKIMLLDKLNLGGSSKPERLFTLTEDPNLRWGANRDYWAFGFLKADPPEVFVGEAFKATFPAGRISQFAVERGVSNPVVYRLTSVPTVGDTATIKAVPVEWLKKRKGWVLEGS